jgi:hypothetical protein
MRFFVLTMLVVLGAAAADAGAQDPAEAIIRRALKAHGGEEKLAGLRADRARLKGTLQVGDRVVPFTSEAIVQLPAQMKNVMQLDLDGKMVTLVQLVNGDQLQVLIDGQPQKTGPNSILEMRDKLYLARIMRLVPLVTDKAFTLTLLPPMKIGERPVDVVKVTAKDQRDARLFFDRETGLLVRTEVPLTDNTGRELGKEEQSFSDFRDLAGFIRPVKMSAARNGTKVMEAELVEIKYYERIDDAEFTKP